MPPTSVLYGRHCTGYYYVTANILVTLRCVGHVPSTSIMPHVVKSPRRKALHNLSFSLIIWGFPISSMLFFLEVLSVEGLWPGGAYVSSRVWTKI